MKNLNIYTWRELSQMYIDGRPMPDVAFVTQTDAMKLQSICKEENEGWITDRKPTLQDCTADSPVGGKYNCVYDSKGMLVNFWTINEGEAWKPVPNCEPYVKPKRHFVVWSELFNCWSLRESSKGGAILLADHVLNVGLTKKNEQHREAAERIAAIYEEVMP